MKTLYQPEATNEILVRIEKLNPAIQRLWGKMDVAQMMAHCSVAMEVAAGLKFPPRIFISQIIAPFFKAFFINDKPFKKNTPTEKSYIIVDSRNFEKEKDHLIQLINRFSIGGKAHCTKHPHSFFGPLTPKEWGIGMYKHLDHYLRQFGV